MKTPFLHLLPPRLARTLERLKSSIWTVSGDSLPISASPATDAHVSFADRPASADAITGFPHFWGRSFQQRWFVIDAAPSAQGDFTHLLWKDRGEATLYVDGVPWGGFDPGHPYVGLPGSFSSLHVEAICCRTGIWVNGETQGIDDRGSRLEGAFLARRDEAAWQAYYDFAVLWDLLEWTAANDRGLQDPEMFASPMRVREHWWMIHPLVRILVDGLDRAVDVYDRQGAEALSAALRPLYEKVRGGLAGARATITGHAHIDLVWLWPERIGEAKAVHTFANAESLMRKYPEFVFGYSQPASYRAVARRSPALMDRVAARIAERRWEPVGVLEIESDTHMPCGEALARNFLLGQDGFVRLTGSPGRVVWLPDVFGYSACLPRLMSECGVEFFYTTKLAWSTYERFPYTSFRWRGHDGTEVLAHVMGCNQDYNNHATITHLANPVRGHRQVHLHPDVLIPTGYGDGGGGPTEEMCERVRRSADLLGVPSASWGRIDEFFERLRPAAADLPVWEGEMYLEFHRGVFTTHAAVKQTFRAFERALQTLEAAHCVSGRGPINIHYWRRLVFSQFHDDIPGSSIIEVYEESLAERRGLIARSETEASDCFGGGERTALFNPLAMPVARIVDTGVLTISPLGVAKREEARPPTAGEACIRSGNSLANNRCRLEWNDDGSLAGLAFDGRPVPLLEDAGSLRIYPDHPAIFEAWDIDRNSVGMPLPAAEKPELLGIEESPARVLVRFRQQLTARSHAEFSYVVEAASPVVRLEIDVTWADDKALLRWECPTGYRGQSARYGAPFGSVTRPQRPGPLATEAQFEVPGSRWAVIGNDGEQDALALLTKDRYGFGCAGGSLHCTLLRSALITETETNRPLRNPSYTHTHSDHGTHHFSLALASGRIDAARDEQPAALADSLFTELLQVAPGASTGICLPEWEAGPTLVPSWIKPAEDGNGWILRLHETRCQRGRLHFTDSGGWMLSHTNLLEQSGQPLPPGQPLEYGPCDLLSIRLTRMAPVMMALE